MYVLFSAFQNLPYMYTWQYGQCEIIFWHPFKFNISGYSTRILLKVPFLQTSDSCNYLLLYFFHFTSNQNAFTAHIEWKYTLPFTFPEAENG